MVSHGVVGYLGAIQLLHCIDVVHTGDFFAKGIDNEQGANRGCIIALNKHHG
jgi:hypothetical protein